MKYAWFLLVVPLALVGAGCRAKSQLPVPNDDAAPLPPVVAAPQNETPEQATTTQNVTLALSTDKVRYRRGEMVHLTLTVRNTGQEKQSLHFMSGQVFDITATQQNADGKTQTELWKWSADKVFTMALRTQTLAAGETQTLTAIWEGGDNNGNIVPRGKYRLQAQLVSRPPIAAPPQEINLVD